MNLIHSELLLLRNALASRRAAIERASHPDNPWPDGEREEIAMIDALGDRINEQILSLSHSVDADMVADAR